jgi:mannitol-1-/sugar-/sorbitol-6-phosphatase
VTGAARRATARDDLPTLLFDLDGTLVDSRVVIARHWQHFAERHGLELDAILAVCHGRRSAETIAEVAPSLDAHAEAAILDAAEEVDTDGLVVVPGAPELLASLTDAGWGVVTSGHRTLATRRLSAVALPVPAVLVCGDDVERGKPDPEGFLRAAALLGVDSRACIVVEDAPAGIAAGIAAGATVVAVETTHRADALAAAHAVVSDLHELATLLAAGALTR